jgi:triphosphatase
MGEASRELELKVELTNAAWERLLENPALRTLADGVTRTRELTSVYFDTEDCVIHGHGMSLRMRRTERGWLQTLKAKTGVRGGVSNPLEIEVDLDAAEPDPGTVEGPAGEKLRALIGRDALRPMFQTVVRRSSRRLVLPEGGAIELALDEGHVRAGEATAELREAELELLAGDASSLLTVAEALLAGVEFRFGSESKAERGYRLLRGEPDPAAKPEKSIAEPLTEGQSCAEAFAAACRSAARQVLHNWQVVLESADPEGPHQLRIGLRRLRTALHAFRPAIDSDALRQLLHDARHLSRRVGELRDLDVLSADIVGPLVSRGGDRDGFVSLVKLLRRRITRQRTRLQRELGDARWSSFRLRLALLEHGAGWGDCATQDAASQPALSQARWAMQKAWKRVKRYAQRLEELSVDERHELRKRLKRLRYSAEFFLPLFDDAEAGRFVKRIRRMLDTFGYLNDVAMAEMLIDICRAEGTADADRDHAAGYVLGWHSARAEKAWEGVPLHWRRLKRSERFWR